MALPENPSESTLAEFKEFREDGWPLCPNCGEDELANPGYSSRYALNNLFQVPTAAQFLEAGLWCYNCDWQSANFKANEGKRCKYVCDQCGKPCKPVEIFGPHQYPSRVFIHGDFRIVVLIMKPPRVSSSSNQACSASTQFPAADLCAKCISECISVETADRAKGEAGVWP